MVPQPDIWWPAATSGNELSRQAAKRSALSQALAERRVARRASRSRPWFAIRKPQTTTMTAAPVTEPPVTTALPAPSWSAPAPPTVQQPRPGTHSSPAGEDPATVAGRRIGRNDMTLFMDVHTISGGVAAGDVAGAHEADLATQGAHGVNYLRYWVDESAGKIFCLVEAPSAEAANAVHREAHGLVADEIYPVLEHS